MILPMIPARRANVKAGNSLNELLDTRASVYAAGVSMAPSGV